MNVKTMRAGLVVAFVLGTAAPASAAVEITGPETVAEGQTAEYTVRETNPFVTTTVPVTLSGCTADAELTTGGCTTSVTLGFFAGGYSETVTAQTVADSRHEGPETITLTGAESQATTTIVDGDAPPVLSVADTSAPESANLVFTITKTGGTALPARAHWKATPATGTEAADVGTPLEGDITIPPSAESATVTVPVTKDLTDEPDEAVTLTLTTPASDANATLGDAVATGTIVDDDAEPAATVAPADADEGDTATFGVTLARASELPVTLDYGRAPGGTAASADLTGPVTGDVSIPAGQTTGSFTVATAEDATYERDETFVMFVTGGDHATGTIRDDDPEPTLAVGDAAAVAEGGTLSFPVTKTGETALPAKAHWKATPATGTEAADLGTPLEGDVTIPPSAESATVTVPVVNDDIDEPDEAVTLTLTLPDPDANATLGDAVATGTIVDDDAEPAATVAPAATDEGDTATFGVTLARASELPVMLDYGRAPGGTAASADLSGPVAGEVSIPAGQTTGSFAVATAEDTTFERDETFVMAVTGGDDAVGTIRDDDAKPTLAIGDAAAVAEGGTLSFPITKSGETAFPARVAWSVTAGEVAGSRSGFVELPAGVTTTAIMLTTTADVVDELDEPVTVALTALADGDATVGTPSSASGTVIDDDTAALSVVAAGAEEAEGSVLVPIALSTPSDRNVSVAYRTEAGTATAGSDYQERDGRITVPAGQTGVVLPLALVDDADVEGDETFDLVLSDPEPASTPITVARATQTIRSADVAPKTGGGEPTPDTPTTPTTPSTPSATPTPTADAPAASDPVAAQGSRFPTDDTSAPRPVVTGLKLKGSTLSVRFKCPAAERLCRGTLSVLTVPNKKAKDRRLRKELTLGSRVAVVPGGKSATFTLKLSKARRKLLKGKTVRAVAFAVVRDAAGNLGTASMKATLKAK